MGSPLQIGGLRWLLRLVWSGVGFGSRQTRESNLRVRQTEFRDRIVSQALGDRGAARAAQSHEAEVQLRFVRCEPLPSVWQKTNCDVQHARKRMLCSPAWPAGLASFLVVKAASQKSWPSDRRGVGNHSRCGPIRDSRGNRITKSGVCRRACKIGLQASASEHSKR